MLTMMILAYQDFTYPASSLLLFAGYSLYVTGVVTPSWRAEIGYVYGLWQRCDRGVCINVFTGIRDYLTLVRGAMTLALISLTAAVVCLLTEMSLKRWMRRSSRRRKHLTRLGRAISVSASVGEMLAAVGLALYGYRAVLTHRGYPVLLWSVPVTGLGLMLCLLSSILRALGPIKTWGKGNCCLAPPPRGPHRKDREEPRFPALETPLGYRRQVLVRDVGGWASCCAAQWSDNDDYSTSTDCSLFSSRLAGAGTNDSGSRHYRHYEELSFRDMSDMPPPPPEMLAQPPPQHPPLLFHRQAVVPYPDPDFIVHCSQPGLHNGSLDNEELNAPNSAFADVGCAQSLGVGSSATWHRLPHQSTQQRPIQYEHIPPNEHQQHQKPYTQQVHTYLNPLPAGSPYCSSSLHARHTLGAHPSARPKASPRRLKNQSASPRTPANHGLRRSSRQSGRSQHCPRGSVSSVKSSPHESSQIRRYETMSLSSRLGT